MHKTMLRNMLGVMVVMETFDLTYGDCSRTELLPELSKRSRTYKADGVRGSDPYVDDTYLEPNWYSVVLNGEQWLMPDANYKPKFRFCGTVQPIYLNGTHPTKDNLTESPISVMACELYPYNSCLNMIPIEIRKCGNEVQYYLRGTSSNAAFCLDPPALQNVTDFTEPPNIKLGTLNVSPELGFKESVEDDIFLLPFLTFVCNETGGGNRMGETLTYTTYWYINDILSFAFEKENGFSLLTEEHLISRNITLGIQVRCGAKLARSATGLKGNLTTGTNFFAGITVGDKLIHMSKNESKTIMLQSTIPYGCYGTKNELTSATCKTKVHMIVPEPSNCELSDTNVGGQNVVNYHTSHQAICGFEVEGCYPNELPCSKTMQPAFMNITTQFFSNDDPDSYRFKLVVQNAGTHQIWKGYNIEEVVVHIKDDIDYKNKVCFSHVDPHMQTADGRTYENNNFHGQFILYWNRKYHTMVQEQTIPCNNDRAYCTCALAIRAGGDVFLINLCNDLKFIGMTSCKDNGALIIQKYSEFDYQVQTNIGTLIKIRIRPYANYEELMNVDIIMAPKDFLSISGLCGTFDSNKENDFHDRNGDDLTGRVEFINAWKLADNETNYLRPTCQSEVKTWEDDGQQLFCFCDCYDNEKQYCGAPETEAVCSPSQYINCTVKEQETENLCRYFSHKCQTEARRRRSSFTVDPEKEMKRRATLADRRTLAREKRQSDEHKKLSKDEVKKLCTDAISKSLAYQKYSNLLGGYNHSVIINHCIFDVYEGQDTGWLGAHEMAMKDAVQVGFKRNAKYTESHKEELVEFKRQYCPSDCNDNGVCTDEGICLCNKSYFGPDCGNDISLAPQIEDVEGGGICDMNTGSKCKCFEVQVDALAEVFHCRRTTRSVTINGSSTTNEDVQVNGFYMNFFTGECCFESYRNKQHINAIDQVIFYEFDVSLSNDGNNFGPLITLHVYDSLCQEFFTDINGKATVRLKDGTCSIENYCVEGNKTDIKDTCRRCIPKQNRFKWTFDCKDEATGDANQSKLYIIIAAGSGAFVIVLLLCVIYHLRRRNHSGEEHVDQVAGRVEGIPQPVLVPAQAIGQGGGARQLPLIPATSQCGSENVALNTVDENRSSESMHTGVHEDNKSDYLLSSEPAYESLTENKMNTKETDYSHLHPETYINMQL